MTADPGVTHGTAELQPGVKIHYVEAGTGPRILEVRFGKLHNRI